MKIRFRVVDDQAGTLNEELLVVVQSALTDTPIERVESSGEGKMAPGLLEAFLVSLAAGVTIELTKAAHRWVTGTTKTVAVSLIRDDGTTESFEIKSGQPLPPELAAAISGND